MVFIIAGDIGGTNARFTLFEVSNENISRRRASEVDPTLDHARLYQAYRNDDYRFFADVLGAFLTDAREAGYAEITAACFAVAGPVRDNRINFTNREGWILDAEDIRHSFGIQSVMLLNDFVSNGYGLLTLDEEDLVTLQEGSPSETSPIACVGAGTGLGECFLTPGPDGVYDAYASEGGHVEFYPRNAEEDALLQYMRRRFCMEGQSTGFNEDAPPRISVERLVSGHGLVNIYEFLCDRYPEDVKEDLDREIHAAKDRGYMIAKSAWDYPLCERAMAMMFSIYGSEVGNVALKFLPYGGLFIAGGIAPKNIERIQKPDSEFMQSLLRKGRVSGALKDVRV